MKRFDPTAAVGGTIEQGIDPSSLLAGRDELELSRLELQRQLLAAGQKRATMIVVNCQGIVLQGNHGVRAAAEAGVAIEVEVVDVPYRSYGRVVDLPIARR